MLWILLYDTIAKVKENMGSQPGERGKLLEVFCNKTHEYNKVDNKPVRGKAD